MREPPAVLLRLTRFLGAEPPQTVSRVRYWYPLIFGAAIVVLFACLWLLPPGPTGTRPFSEPTELVVGLMLAAQEAAGLLREDRRGLSLWLSALGALLFVVFVFSWVPFCTRGWGLWGSACGPCSLPRWWSGARRDAGREAEEGREAKVRCPNCGAWSARHHIQSCSECGAELVPVPDYRGRAIAAAVLCTFFGVVALYFSVQTHRALAAGDYPGARRASELARSWANAGLWLALAGLLFFGTILLLEAMGPS